jgi:hypothetical protein
MTARALRFTEYDPREVRMRRVDVDSLIALRGAVEVIPTHRRHHRVKAHDVAGVVLTPNLRVFIQSKTPRVLPGRYKGELGLRDRFLQRVYWLFEQSFQ